MSITLVDVSCMLHLPIRGRLLDHNEINREDALEMMVGYLGANPWDSIKELEVTLWAHASF